MNGHLHLPTLQRRAGARVRRICRHHGRITRRDTPIAANLVTLARTAVEFDYRGDVVDAHAPEAPTRFAKQLTQVMRGAIAIGLSHESGLRLAIRVARDSMPPMRLAIIDDLAKHPYSTPTDVRKRLGKPRATVDRQLQALHSLHVVALDEETGDQRTWWHYTLAAGIDPKALLVPEISIKGTCTQMEYLDSDKAGTNGAPRPRTGRNICEVCERALARTDTGMCDFCTVKQQRHAGGVA